ncbi:hypothetical protein HanIR_Chr03g0114261 [Helianthus annuus]|nr:hypothetical protein HanIR_Chr03g0114261 [Helianthus annuus]
MYTLYTRVRVGFYKTRYYNTIFPGSGKVQVCIGLAKNPHPVLKKPDRVLNASLYVLVDGLAYSNLITFLNKITSKCIHNS